jgi:(p)ppGpp synthase/HD superfamily hydrolase
MNLLEQAKLFATQKHVLDNHQLYGNLVPYTHHLAAVEAVLVRFGFSDDVIRVASWCHDIIEDTRDRPNQVKRRDIEEMFGEEVADLVWAVTSEEGDNRKVRNALTYPKIRATGVRAVALKLADRIANVENGGRAVSMYRKEHPDFKHGIYIPVIAPAGDPGPGFKDNLRVYEMQEHLDGPLR